MIPGSHHSAKYSSPALQSPIPDATSWSHACQTKIAFSNSRCDHVVALPPKSGEACKLHERSLVLFPYTKLLLVSRTKSVIYQFPLRGCANRFDPVMALPVSILSTWTHYRGENKCLYEVAINFFLLLLNCSAWPCLGPT